MANFITIGGELVNLDKVCHIQVYTCTNDVVMVEVEYERSVKQIPCAGTEDEVREGIRYAVRQILGIIATGPAHISEAYD